MSMSSRNTKRKHGRDGGPLDLAAKVAAAGGDGSFGLEKDTVGAENENLEAFGNSGIYGGRRSIASRGAASLRSASRTFRRRPPSSKRQGPLTGLASTRSSSSLHSHGQSLSRIKRSSSRMDSSIRSGRVSRARSTMVDKASVHIVCAIGENLAMETCVASLDAGSPTNLQVTKQGNGQTYAETIAYLEMLQPHEVLLNEGRRNSHLAKKVLQMFDNDRNSDPAEQRIPPSDGEQYVEAERLSGPCETSTVVKFISRSCFDQTKGAALLRRLARRETYDATLVEEYILLSSTHAVLHYTQQALGASFSRNCLDISVNSGGKNRMTVDRSTILQLEVLSNAKTGKTRNTLVSTIDCTKTTVGSRLLRTNLIAPPCRIDTINARLDLVDTFLEDEEFFYAVLEHLQSLPPVDKMLTNVAIVPRKGTGPKGASSASNTTHARLASKGISALVCIKSTLTALPALSRLLKDHVNFLEEEEGQNAGDSIGANRMNDQGDAVSALTSKSGLLTGLGSGPSSKEKLLPNQLLKAIIYTISKPDLAAVREKVADMFTPSTKFSRSANAMRHQECFALKSADNGMMDVIRKAFLANVDDIYKKADKYAELHGIHVSVKYSASRGYYLSVPAEFASGLPNLFIQPAKSGKFIHCTTEEVHSLNIRAQDNVQDLLLMTHDRIHEALEFARSKYDALAALSDAVALLDLCHSFADNVTLNKRPWCRPVMTTTSTEESKETPRDRDSTALAIRNGRYAIDVEGSCLASPEGPDELVPNDTYAKEGKCFTLITGINGSGKSTYLKQIGLIVILAHCGSYVPAEHALIPLRVRLCARMGTSDDQENNISSFMLEMNETAFLCNNSPNGAMILIDELGRATGNQDGLAIAWAVAEFLLSKRAMTFFVTHYRQLCELGTVYKTVQNQHLQAVVPSARDGIIQYTHKVGMGPCAQNPDYGVNMAASCGWPRDTVAAARQIESTLQGWLGCQSIAVEGNTLLSIIPRGTEATSLRDLSGRLLDFVQAGSSVAFLRSFLQKSIESSGQVRESTMRARVLDDTESKVVSSSCTLDESTTPPSHGKQSYDDPQDNESSRSSSRTGVFNERMSPTWRRKRVSSGLNRREPASHHFSRVETHLDSNVQLAHSPEHDGSSKYVYHRGPQQPGRWGSSDASSSLSSSDEDSLSAS